MRQHAGADPEALGRLAGLIEDRGAVAQACVIADGEVIFDRSFGCRPDPLFLLFSAGKPFTAVLVHLLAERGRLRLDDPVARYWPEFSRHGKGAITVRQVLQHRSGLPVARGLWRDALAAASWTRSVRALENARPRSPRHASRRLTARSTSSCICRSAGHRDSSSAARWSAPPGHGRWAASAAPPPSGTTAPTAAWAGPTQHAASSLPT